MEGHTKQRAQRNRKSVLAYDGHPGIDGGTHKTKSTKKQKKCTRLRWTSRDRWRDTQNKEHKETEKVYSPTMNIQG